MIIITGSDGWIGTHLCSMLDTKEVDYLGFDRKTDYDLLSTEGQAEFEKALADASAVIHLAARPRIPPSWKTPQDYIQDNISLTEYIARKCAEYRVHLVFASSSSVYGNGAGPLNPYSWTKKSCEDIISIYGNTLGLESTICRIFTCYSEDAPSGEQGLVIGTWLAAVRKRKPILVRGTGEQTRDFVHIDDVADALFRAAILKPKNSIIDIGTGDTISLNQIAETFNMKIIREPELKGYAVSTQADIKPASEQLGWTPTVRILNWINSVLNRNSN